MLSSLVLRHWWDLAEKWYGKTQSCLKKFLLHLEFIGDLVKMNTFHFNANAYRKPEHCLVWGKLRTKQNDIWWTSKTSSRKKRTISTPRWKNSEEFLGHANTCWVMPGTKWKKMELLNSGFEYDKGRKILCDFNHSTY